MGPNAKRRTVETSRAQGGQASVEWVGLVCALALALGALLAAGVRLPGADLARSLADRILCAASLGGDCGGASASGGADSPLAAAYGPELAGLVAAGAPRISYEQGMVALPVDFRGCRETACSDGAAEGRVDTSEAGEPVTVFVRVIDCRGSAAARLLAASGSARPGARVDETGPADVGEAIASAAEPDQLDDCHGEAAGNVYIQYWFYYPTSRTTLAGVGLSGVTMPRGYHPDDWESFQLRIGSDGRMARASSHQSFTWRRDARGLLSDSGLAPRAGWGPDSGRLFVSRSSHAGHASTEAVGLLRTAARASGTRHRAALRRASRRLPGEEGSLRWTPAAALRLVPLEPIAASDRGQWQFEVRPPWRRASWHSPELETTGWRP